MMEDSRHARPQFHSQNYPAQLAQLAQLAHFATSFSELKCESIKLRNVLSWIS